jgi:hypothetical protein
MTERMGAELNLIKLSDPELALEDREQNIRGLDVHDSSGEQIGSVADLYVGEEHYRVRFLDVRAGGFHFLIPVEAVDEVKVTVDQSRQKVVDWPPFDTSVTPHASYQRDIYNYYGPGRPAPGAWPGGMTHRRETSHLALERGQKGEDRDLRPAVESEVRFQQAQTPIGVQQHPVHAAESVRVLHRVQGPHDRPHEGEAHLTTMGVPGEL